MPEGIEVDVKDGVAEIGFIDPAMRGPALTRLLDVAGPEFIDKDSGGTRITYKVPENIAAEAGLIDTPKRGRGSKKADKTEEGGTSGKGKATQNAPVDDTSGG